MKALLREIELTNNFLDRSSVETIYFGGGTPSLPDPSYISAIMEAIRYNHPVSGNCEISLEVNPDDVNSEKLNDWISTGINRISLGIQSFNTDDLEYLDRKHSPENAFHALEIITAAPLISFSVDLIYAIPCQTSAALSKNLDICMSAGTPHLSCYSLTVENNTPLYKHIGKGIKTAPSDNRFIKHWNLLKGITHDKGYLHYEISNFCKPHHFSRHNVNYWNNTPYLGLGPSAHSFNLKSRRWNHQNLAKYIAGTTKGSAVASEETLTFFDKVNEHIMTRLRTMWGVRLQDFSEKFGILCGEKLLEMAVPFISKGLLIIENDTLKITDKGMPLTDSITSALFLIQP